MATSVSVAMWLEKIGLQSLSPIFEGNFQTLDIFHSKILIHSERLEFLSPPLFFSGGSGVLSEVNYGGGGWNFYFLLVGGGGSEISCVPPTPRYI